MIKVLTAKELSEINRELTLALIGARGKARRHIERVLEMLNGTSDTKTS